MKIRTCDICSNIIKNATEYIKCCSALTTKQHQILKWKGDICLKCWKDLFRIK